MWYFFLCRGTRSSFGSLLPIGRLGQERSMSVVTARLLIEDHLGTRVLALKKYRFWEPKNHSQKSFSVNSKTLLDKSAMSLHLFYRMLTVKSPVSEDAASQWLTEKSQTELHTLVQQGNPQEIIPYAIALTSHLNQVRY